MTDNRVVPEQPREKLPPTAQERLARYEYDNFGRPIEPKPPGFVAIDPNEQIPEPPRQKLGPPTPGPR